MSDVPEGKEPLKEKALDYALKAAVWIKNGDGNYETIIPRHHAHFRHLIAGKAPSQDEGNPLLCCEPADNSCALHLIVSAAHIQSQGYAPILLDFKESSLPQHQRNYTQALLFLLNSEWEKEHGGMQNGEEVYHTVLPIGDLARGFYAFMRDAFGRKPEKLNTWNGAKLYHADEDKAEVHFHLGEPLTLALFDTTLENLMAWRRSLEKPLSTHCTASPELITVTTDYTTLRKLPENGADPVITGTVLQERLTSNEHSTPHRI